MPRVRAVLLDVDGTLVDSNTAHAQAWVQALNRQGYVLQLREVRPWIGMGSDRILSMVGVEEHSSKAKRIQAARKQVFATLVPHLRPTRGARQLVERLEQAGITTIIASSATRDDIEPLLKIAEVPHLLDTIAGEDDVDHSKPDPDIIQAAIDRAGVHADAAIMIGDTPYDMEAAARAGVLGIALRCGGWWSDRTLSKAMAIYDDPDDLLRQFDISPLSLATHPVRH